jgi:hypothetical protein
MAAREMLERFSNEVMSEAFKTSEDSEGKAGVVGDAFM